MKDILANIGSGNGFLPVCHQAISLTNADFLSTGSLYSNKPHQNFYQNTKPVIQENAFKDVTCRMSAILFKPHYVNFPIFATYLRARPPLITSSSGMCFRSVAFRSPYLVYSSTMSTGSASLHTPSTRAMLGSFKPARTRASCRKCSLEMEERMT